MDQEAIANQVRMCAACPKMCRHVCPTFFAWRSESPTPHGRALLLHQENSGTRELDDRGIEVLYQCLECSHCLTWCQPEIDIAEIVEHKRRLIVQDGRYPSGLDSLKQNILEHHNPFGEDHVKRTEWFKTSEKTGEELVYFVGCTASYREVKIAQQTQKLLGSLGYSLTVSEDEWCCGSPLFRTGFTEDALKQAEYNVEMLNAQSGDTIVVTCPGCYRVLRNDYPEYGLELKKPVRHISELLEEKLNDLPKTAIDGTVTYHDPCHLGRHMGVYDAPRQVLEKIADGQFIEMERNRDNAMCCGNGAGMRTLFGEKAQVIGSERVKQALDVNAKYLVTSCPFCKNMLASQGNGKIEVFDLPEFVIHVSELSD
ncbi:MAG: (Fe-S)-binding protein [Candidatus Thorarchaeota archaeon]